MRKAEVFQNVLLLAERFAATSAFAHSLAFCRAIEKIYAVEVPARAAHLRIALCELERLRHHAGVIAAICESTALAVSAAHAAISEEELLRASCVFTGHRYLFGLNVPGGLRRDVEVNQCKSLLAAVDKAQAELRVLEDRLRYSSSFLDRLEDVGVIDGDQARDLNLVGPVGRASGRTCDLRKACPYSGYERYQFDVPHESEGDGYARMRVLFAESLQSVKLIHQAIDSLKPGPLYVPCGGITAGARMGRSAARSFASASVFVAGRSFEASLWVLQGFGPLTLRLDVLSSVFLLTAGIVYLSASLFVRSFIDDQFGARYPAHRYGVMYFALMASVALILMANDAPLFLISWECMLILCFLLINYEQRQQADKSAGYIMLAMVASGLSNRGLWSMFLLGFLDFGVKAGWFL